MKVTTANNPVIILTLTMEEASWIRNLMKNPVINTSRPVEESKDQAEKRKNLFTALDSVVA